MFKKDIDAGNVEEMTTISASSALKSLENVTLIFVTARCQIRLLNNLERFVSEKKIFK